MASAAAIWKALEQEKEATVYLSANGKKAQARDYWVEKGRALVKKLDATLTEVRTSEEASVDASMEASATLYSHTRSLLAIVSAIAVAIALRESLIMLSAARLT